MLLLLIYSVIGVSFLATVKLQDNMNSQANFQSFWNAMLTLFRCTTGEAWNTLMHDASRQRSILFQCSNEQYSGGEINGCGSKAAIPFFISFMLIVSITFMNMFIAIILEGFDEYHEEEIHRVQTETIDDFTKSW